MKPKQCNGKVVSNIKILDNIYEMKLTGDFQGNPGQFYMLRSWGKEPFLSRPLSICNIEGNLLTFLYEVKGKGTDIFSKLREGDVLNLLGPLGTGFPLNNKGKIGVVAGGIGIAPMIYLCRSLKGDIDFYGGFREKSFYMDRIEENIDKLYISTDSGKEGHNGFITDIFNPEEYSVVYTCGPMPMMAKVKNICEEKNVPIYISMEKRMACGVGACLGCSIKTTSGIRRVCKDGPVFRGEEIVFHD